MKDFLLLCNRPASGANASTISEHLDAIHGMDGWRVWEVSMVGQIPGTIDLDRFDAIGIHYSLHISDKECHFLSEKAMDLISNFSGVKCVWLHDEYRHVNLVVNKLKKIGVDVVFSLTSSPTMNILYPQNILSGVKLEKVFAGYISDNILEYKDKFKHKKNIDVSYRARRPPFWLGSLGQEKINIGIQFLAYPQTKALTTDISVEEHDRLYGNDWYALLGASRCVLCVESGSSIVDFDGSIESAVTEYTSNTPDAQFEDVYDKYIKKTDNVNKIAAISPRIFEAAVMRTTLVCFEGEYEGMLKPWLHYIPLKKDFSNINEVVDSIRNLSLCEQLASQVYHDFVENDDYKYRTFSKHCSNTLSSCFVGNIPYKKKKEYNRFLFNLILNMSPTYFYHTKVARLIQWILLSTFIRSRIISIWGMLPDTLKKKLHPYLKIIGR